MQRSARHRSLEPRCADNKAQYAISRCLDAPVVSHDLEGVSETDDRDPGRGTWQSNSGLYHYSFILPSFVNLGAEPSISHSTSTLTDNPQVLRSSFFGMNTPHVRDMKHDQPVFWSIRILITVAVFTLAFLYGYKEEMIQDLISLAMGSRKAQVRRRSRIKEQPMRAEIWFSTTSARRDPEVPKNKALRSWLHRGKRVGWEQRTGQGKGVAEV